MVKRKLRTGDTVVIITGKDKGKSGKIRHIDTKTSRVYVEGANIIKRHQRANPARPNITVGVIEKEGPIHISNVALADPKGGKPTKVGIRRTDGSRVRIAKGSQSEIESTEKV